MTGTGDRFVHYRLGTAGVPRVLRPFAWLLGVIATGVAITLGAVPVSGGELTVRVDITGVYDLER